MRNIRALVVDESVVSRLILSAMLESDPAIDVVGTASTGPVALGKILETNPDVVTFDVEIPEREGLRALQAIRRAHPDLPVIVTGERTPRAAATVMEALALGAVDCVAKPAPLDGVNEGPTTFRQELIAKVVGVGSAPGPGCQLALSCLSGAPAPPAQRSGRPAGPVDVVAIGSSTAGPQALPAPLSALPAGPPAPAGGPPHAAAPSTAAAGPRAPSADGGEGCASRAGPLRSGGAGRGGCPGRAWPPPSSDGARPRGRGPSAWVCAALAPPPAPYRRPCRGESPPASGGGL